MDGQGFINIEKVIDQLDIEPNMTVADFGAGHGFFSVALAKKVGPSGRVFAIDILPSALEAIKSKARTEGFFNIKLIKGDLEKIGGSTLPNESCDLVFVTNVLFQIFNRAEIINEANRVLKKSKELAVVEWKPYIGIGPQKENRLSEEELKKIIISKGFSELKKIDTGSHHFGFIFKKN